MAREIRSFAVAVPAGTTIAAPQVSSLAMPPRLVSAVRVRIPPGPSGLVGWALGAAGQRVLPWGAQQWIVADDEVIRWELSGQITSGAWELQAYNLGSFTHTLYLQFELEPVGSAATPGGLTPIDLSA